MLLSQRQSISGAQLFGLAFDLVDLVNLLQRELRELALVCCVQVKEFAACVGYASRFRDALGKAGLVAAEVIAYQTTSPFTEEASSVLPRSRFTKVVDHRLLVFEGSGGIGPQVSTVGLPLPGLSIGTGVSSARKTLLWSISALSASTGGSKASQPESTRIIATTTEASECIQTLRRWANAR